MPMLWSIKAQEIRAGGFTVRFGAHHDDSNTSYMQITGKTEGHQITFNKDGDILKIMPLKIGGEPYQQNDKAPSEANRQAAADAAERAIHDEMVERHNEKALTTEADRFREAAGAPANDNAPPNMPGLETGPVPSPVDAGRRTK